MLRRADMVLIGSLLLCSVLIMAVLFVQKSGGTQVVVRLDGIEVERYSLLSDREIPIGNKDSGHNTLIIKNKTVAILDADCPDKICVKQGKISKSGEIIVCLPHRLTVEIK